MSSSPITETARITASTERRPSSLQYTSSRCSTSANSSRVSPQPIPKTTASTLYVTGPPRSANAPIPPTSIITWPKTTWWMWTPPGVTLPGHQLHLAPDHPHAEPDEQEGADQPDQRQEQRLPAAVHDPALIRVADPVPHGASVPGRTPGAGETRVGRTGEPAIVAEAVRQGFGRLRRRSGGLTAAAGGRRGPVRRSRAGCGGRRGPVSAVYDTAPGAGSTTGRARPPQQRAKLWSDPRRKVRVGGPTRRSCRPLGPWPNSDRKMPATTTDHRLPVDGHRRAIDHHI